MDITSYLLGKKASGGGGGSTGYDWQAIGLSKEPSFIGNGYDYAVDLQTNWTPTTDLIAKFTNDYNLIFMPSVTLYPAGSTNVNLSSAYWTCVNLKVVAPLDTGEVTNMSSMFANCYSLEQVPLFNTAKVKNMLNMFQNCYSLKQVPTFDTTNATNMSSMFNYCYSLVSAPKFTFNKYVQLNSMFSGCTNLVNLPAFESVNDSGYSLQNFAINCPNLSDESLNNIMYMCIHSQTTNVNMMKLSIVGLNNTQIAKCQTLSNYQDFVNAGWSAS